MSCCTLQNIRRNLPPSRVSWKRLTSPNTRDVLKYKDGVLISNPIMSYLIYANITQFQPNRMMPHSHF